MISSAWYADNYSRIMANAFRLDLIDTGVLHPGGDYRAALRALLEGQAEGESGSAVYTVASLFNHSCVPCLEVTFPKNDSMIVLKTNQDVEENVQLTISYIDQDLGVAERERQLAMYGFVCSCHKCREERVVT